MDTIIFSTFGALIGVAGLLAYQAFTNPNRARAFRQAIKAVGKLGSDDSVEAAKKAAEEAALKEQLKDAVAKL